MGKANNIPERDTQYATGEIKRGYFEAVFEVPIEKMGIVERLLQNEFREFCMLNMMLELHILIFLPYHYHHRKWAFSS